MKNRLLIFIISAVASVGFSKDFYGYGEINSVLQHGDLIFHKSQSPQSKAIFEATGSEWSHVGILVKNKNTWYVVEARNGIETTGLQNFINRGKNKEFKILRSPDYKDSTMRTRLHNTLRTYRGKKYDIYFEFNNSKIYCSELTYKVMKTVTGKEIGTVNKMKELRLDGPYVKELIKRRLTDLGKELNPNEPIITPVSQLYDFSLDLVAEN